MATRPGGALERFATAAAQHGGSACYVEVAAVKGFRRSLQKAQQDYGGDYLMINDIARCSIVTPGLVSLAEVFTWLVMESGSRPRTRAREWLAPEDTDDMAPLPSFEPLLVKDRLSLSFDAEGMYRYVLLVGKLACDSGENINVEIQLHIKRVQTSRALHPSHAHCIHARARAHAVTARARPRSTRTHHTDWPLVACTLLWVAALRVHEDATHAARGAHRSRGRRR